MSEDSHDWEEPVGLKKNELLILADILHEASNLYGNHGCNDYYISDTPENRELWEKYMDFCDPNDPDRQPQVTSKGIMANDSVMMAYLRMRICEVLDKWRG